MGYGKRDVRKSGIQNSVTSSTQMNMQKVILYMKLVHVDNGFFDLVGRMHIRSPNWE
jgi:hypothetical protein